MELDQFHAKVFTQLIGLSPSLKANTRLLELWAYNFVSSIRPFLFF